ncbi:GNAT family N-acetyltransferase [Bailinhaonella thermotolerans]|uniref:GNAT family N-acetyltransferase n=1 Tax=Bailinhaonella thermotolerans TaxID=1070861 RepID=A0A3A4AWB1_9ACTN|nr:GNAT family N-acetyltransferase [Bailinhaonella thermotolerans]RJL33163.1 GNAT family N-acetyltransferase [Bailinhaonella thermotolerans]
MRQRVATRAEIVEAWVRGWAASRGTSAPVAVPGGFLIEVGLPGHVARYVLAEYDRSAVHDLAASVTVPGTWIKVCADPAEVTLPAGWEIQPADHMMTGPLDPVAPVPPAPYSLRVAAEGDVTVAEVRAPDGEVAARGRLARSGGYGIPDQIRTEPAHRRRGLGGVVMRALTASAHSGGARTGVLVATLEGRALYETLGWTLRSLVTAAVYRPA